MSKKPDAFDSIVVPTVAVLLAVAFVGAAYIVSKVCKT